MAKLVRFEYQSLACYGVMAGDRVWRIGAPPHDQWEKQGDPIPLSEVRLLAPCIPSKIVAVGLNYRDHAVELNMEIPTEPILFLKPGTSVCGPEDIIRYPSQSEQVDYEAELGIVIKRRTRDIDPSEAPEYILGYTCVNDVTARDLQKRDGQWTRGKGFDTSCSLGPWIVPNLDPTDLWVRCFVNGELRQDGRTRDMIFSVAELISPVSAVMTLAPGDVILTGTPSGVGPLVPGDRVTVEIEGIGRLENEVACYE